MSFLNPLMLFGIAAVSVPIIIHLLNKRKFDRVVWAAMRFLRVSIQQNQRRIRVEDLLLLICRCALLVLLALALARPAMQSAAGGLLGRASVTGVILLDNSASMSHSDGVQSRFDRAKEAAEQAIAAMPAGSSVAIFLVSDILDPLVGEPTFDLNLARRTIREAGLSHRSSDLLPLVQQAMDALLKRPQLRKELYLFTDGQLVGWREFQAIHSVLDESRAEIRTHLVLTGIPEDRNLGVTDLQLASGLSPVDRPLRFVAEVTNYGQSEAHDVRVSLRLNEDPPADDAVIGSIPPGSSRRVSLFARLRQAGTHTVTASIAADRLPADDARAIALRGLDEVKVLLVDGAPGREPRESETFFLRHALAPVPPAELGGYFIKPQTILPHELSTTRFDGFDAVVLANVADLGPTVVEALDAYVRRGGGLVIFPGPNVHVPFYNEQLLADRKLLPAALGEAAGDASRDEQFITLADRNDEHPIASIWSDGASGTPASAHFYRRFTLIADEDSGFGVHGSESDSLNPGSSGRVVLRYADGTPAMMERNVGQGRVVLFSSTANTAWNDLPVRPGVFVPLMHRTLGAIVQRPDEALNVAVGQRFIYRTPGELFGREARIQPPGSTDELEAVSARVEMLERFPGLQFDRTDTAGTYYLTIADEQRVEMRFAAQASRQATALEALAADHIEALSPVANVVEWNPGVSLGETIERDRVGTELWLVLAVLALLLAASETLLAHWFSKSK